MWEIGIGPLEIAVFLIAAVGLLLVKPARHWTIVTLACAAVAIIVSPPDPASMLIVAVPMIAIYAAGVSLAGLRPDTGNS